MEGGMTPVTGPASQSGSFLVFTGAECERLREIARLYLAQTTWVLSDDAMARHALTDESVDLILARRAVCERAVA
jgi:hypothetical protein